MRDGLHAEIDAGPWFALSDEQRADAPAPWGPKNPQTLNRYAYVLGNPLKYNDPTGHQGEDILNKAPLDLGDGYRARVDAVPGTSKYEIHVYRLSGGTLKEVGVFGHQGWINKHGGKGPPNIQMPQHVANRLNGLNLAQARSRFLLPPQGQGNIKGYRYLPVEQRPTRVVRPGGGTMMRWGGMGSRGVGAGTMNAR
jgi:hypothetical protein